MENISNKLNEKELNELLEKIKNSLTIERALAEIEAEPVAHIPYSVIQTWPMEAKKNLLNFRKAIANCQCEKCKLI